MNLHNVHAAKNSLWDWTPLNECFQGTSIRVTDLDGFVERNGKFLVLETKQTGHDIPQGQSITFDALLGTGLFTVVLIWGPKNTPKEIRVLTRNGRENKHYKQGSMELLQTIVSNWFAYANGQSTITLPKNGSHVSQFTWDNSTLMVQALGHEGPCYGCNRDMKKGSYFRVTDGRIMHSECVRDWEARSQTTQDDAAYSLRH